MSKSELEALYRMTEQLQADDDMSAIMPCWRDDRGRQEYIRHETIFKLFQTIVHQHMQKGE